MAAKKKVEETTDETTEPVEAAAVEAAASETTETETPPVPSRDKRWKEFLKKAEETNPLFAQQRDNGEFDSIPDSFA